MERKPYYGSGNRSASGRSGSSNRAQSSHARNTFASRPSASRSGGSVRPSGGYSQRSQGRSYPAGRTQPPYGGSRYNSAPPRKRRRRRDPLARLIPLGILVAVLLLIFHVASAWLITTSNRSTYCSNIYVNGLDVSPYTREAGIEYVKAQADARLSTTYTLYGNGQSWSFSVADMGGKIDIGNLMDRAWNIGHVGNIFDCKRDIQSLKDHPIYLNAAFTYDEDKVDALVEQIYNAVYVAPTEAQVVMDVDRPYLAGESTPGQELDRETARALIIDLLENGEGATDLPMLQIEPQVDTETAISSMDLIVEYQTDVSFRDYDSRFNVRKGLSKFDGLTVHPGETIDFNQIVGHRIESAGWREATEYAGRRSTKGIGGGICQASSTLYGAMLKAGMSIIERHPHSMTVAYVEPSIDAAVTDTDDGKNLVFRNDTDTPIYIKTNVTQETATVQVYGKRPPYRYELISTIVSQDSTALHIDYVPDTEGKYCYYVNETKLYKQGHAACSSQGWIVGYDWETGAEVEGTRKQLSYDIYSSGTDIYWRGIHPLEEAESATFDFVNE